MHPSSPTPGGPDRPSTRWRLTGWVACALALLGVGAVVFSGLFRAGVSNVWHLDGLTQHFPGLFYTRQLIHQFLRAPAEGVQMWSFRLGLGADVFGALAFYLADPFSLFAVFVPTAKIEYTYEALYFMRLFCAGIAAYAYIRKMGARISPAILGSLTYVFTTFTLFSALRHPHFATPLVWLPLILLGIEYALERRRYHVLIIAVFFSAASNFYFFYQISIVAIIYAVARFVELTPHGQRRSELVGTAARVGGAYAAGTALAAISLAPALATFFLSTRTDTDVAAPLIAASGYYRLYIGGLTSPYPGGYSFYGGHSILGLLAMPVLFLRKRRHFALKLMLALFPITLLSPVFASFMNGMSYPSYRFGFMWALFLSTGSALLLSDARRITRREAIAALALLAVYAAALIAIIGYVEPITSGPLFFGVLIWAFMLVESVRTKSTADSPPDDSSATNSQRTLEWTRYAVIVVAAAGVLFFGLTSLRPGASSRLEEYLPSGTVLQRFKKDPGWKMASLSSGPLTRMDKQETVESNSLRVGASNDSIVQGFDGASYYYSIAPGALMQFFRDVDLRAMRLAWDYNGLDERATLEALMGVRYHQATSKGEEYVPYGFLPVADAPVKRVSENGNALPLGWVYHDVIDSEQFEAMTPLERQQSLLEGVVLDTSDGADMANANLANEVIDVPFSIAASSTAPFDASTRLIQFPSTDTRLVLDTTAVPNAELYLHIDGISFGLMPELVPGPPEAVQTPSTLHLKARTAESNAAPKVERIEPPSYDYYWGDNSVLINLGYRESGSQQIYLEAGFPSTLNYESLHVYAIPMAGFAERVSNLSEEGLRDVRIGRNSISGSVTARSAGLLFLSVPYSPGWSAIVDGKREKVVRANVGFCGVPIAAGEHDVELHYITPGLVPGAAISGLTVLLLATLVLMQRRKERGQASDIATPADKIRG